MIRRALALALVTAALTFTGQGGVQAARVDRLTINAVDTHARVIKVAKRSDGSLAVGNDLTDAVYTWSKGDPPCDSTGSTPYFGHAWRAGEGTADHWGSIRKGHTIQVGGCSFRVTRVEVWSADRSIAPLYRVGGAPQIVLYACKADDYSKRILVFARLIT